MDPLSVCASVIAVLQAANSVGKTVGKLRSMIAARDEISALLVEVSDLKLVFQNSIEALETLPPANNISEGQRRDVLRLLTRGQEASANFELFIKERLTCKSSSPDNLKINYFAWLSAKQRQQRYQAELKAIQTSLQISLSSTILVQASSTALQVNEMHICMKRVQNENDEARIQIEHAQPVPLIANRLSVDTEAELGRLGPTVPPATSKSVPRLLPQQLYHLHTVNTPLTLRHLLGAISMEYSSSMLPLQPKCKDRRCKGSPNRSLTLKYAFPQWLWLTRVLVRLLTTSYNRPELLLRVSYTRPSSADIFQYAYNGNTQGIRKLFHSRQASPYDTNVTGLTPLHFAVYRDQIETCVYLLSCGADMYVSDDYNNKPIDTAWNKFLSKRSYNIPAMKETFIDKAPTDYMESRQFSVLHNAVLGLDYNSLGKLSNIGQMLQCVDIDVQDTRGLTSLAWAADLDDRQAVYCLLSHGANPNSKDGKMVVPLMRTRDPKCLRMLLESGADVNARDNLQQTPLLHTEHSSVECAKLLLDNGAVIDLPQYSGYTPLHYFVQNSEADLVQLLISRGADCSLCANDGSNIVHSAFRWANAETLFTLAGNKIEGLDLNQKDNGGATGAMLAEMRRKQDPELINAINALEASLHKMQMETLETATASDKLALRDRGLLPKMSPSNVEAQIFSSGGLRKTVRNRAFQIKLYLIVVLLGCIAFWTWLMMGKGFISN